MIETKEGMKSLLEVTRENYIVPEGEEQSVHYIAEKVLIDSKTGKRLSHPDLIKSDLKLFDTIMKRQLEVEGFSVNIVYHPEGKYTEFAPVVDKDAENARLKAELEALKAQLAAEKAPVEKEAPAEAPVESEVQEAPKAETKKAEPKKEAPKAGKTKSAKK